MRHDSRGFTLIEVISALALVLVVLLAMTYQQAAQTKQKAQTSAQLDARRKSGEILTTIIESPERFIYFEDGSNNPVVYVACYNSFGQRVPAAATAPVPGTTDFVGVFNINPANQGSASGEFNGYFDSGNPICTLGQGGWEAHVAPDAATGLFKLSLINLPVAATSSVLPPGTAVYKTNLYSRGNGVPPPTPGGFAGGHRTGRWCHTGLGNCGTSGTRCENQINSVAGTIRVSGSSETLTFCY